ncbi:hypothetical protein GCM10027089_55320 [Nocardia thraciensis]
MQSGIRAEARSVTVIAAALAAVTAFVVVFVPQAKALPGEYHFNHASLPAAVHSHVAYCRSSDGSSRCDGGCLAAG